MKTLKYLRCLVYLNCLWLACCAGHNKDNSETYLATNSEIVEGKGFRHRVWASHNRSTEINTKTNEQLRIYIHGDGQAWLSPTLIAADPSPAYLLSFDLWQKDPNHSILLGRPCYFGVADQHCNAGYWTNARFSEEVVISLAAQVKEVSMTNRNKEIWLIGYSGGGTLATLIADRVEQVNVLVTLAAVLDTDAWTNHHAFSPLNHSLNPADLKLREALQQYHFVGNKDRIAPKEINNKFFQLNDVNVIENPGFDHDCCWVKNWPKLLARIDTEQSRIPFRD